MGGSRGSTEFDLGINLSRWNRAASGVVRDARNIDRALDDVADAANDAERAINDISSSVNVGVEVDTSELESANRLRNDLDSNTSMAVNVDDAEVADLLRQIRDLSVVDIALNVTGTGVGLLTGAVDFIGVGGILEMDTALAQLDATVAESIPGARELIEKLYTDGWGESRTQIAETIGAASRLGIEQENLAGAVETAFQAAQVTGGDVNETLRVMQGLVVNGLVPDYQAAGDVMVAGFQNGLNRADDLNDTLLEYGTTFASLGFDAEGALNILNQGLEGGIDNTDRIADGLREFNILMREVDNEEVQNAIANLGLEDMAEDFRQGTISGEEFLTAVFDGLREIEDPMERSNTAVALFGTQFEDFTTDAFINAINPAVSSMDDIEGAADRAATAFNDTLPAALTQLQRTVSTEIGSFLDEQLDISGMIERAESAVQEFFNALESGQGLDVAIGLALDTLDIPFIEDLQQTLSNFIISFLQGVHSVLQAMPGNQGEAGLQSTISGLAASQLTIDLNMAETEDQIESAVGNAMQRGISASETYDALAAQMGAAFERGDIGMAAAIRDHMSEASDETARLIDIYQSVQNYVPAFQIGEFESRAAEAGLDASRETYTRIRQMIESMEAEGLDPAEFAARGTEAAGAFTQGYEAAFSAAMESGDIGRALQVAIAGGVDSEAIASLSTQVATQFNAALASQDMGAAEALLEPARAALGEFQAQLTDAMTIGGSLDSSAIPALREQINELQSSIALMEGAEVPPPDTAEAESVLAGASESVDELAVSVGDLEQLTGDRTAAVATHLRNMSKETTDVSNDMGKDMGKMRGDFTSTASRAENDMPRVSTAFSTMQANMATTEQQLLPIFTRIREQITGITQAVNGLPSNMGGGGRPISPPPVGGAPGTNTSGPGTTAPTLPIGNRASGGVTEGYTWVGEAGRELMFTDPRVAILNNRTSMQMLELMPSLGMMSAHSEVNNYITNNVVFNAQSRAQEINPLVRLQQQLGVTS